MSLLWTFLRQRGRLAGTVALLAMTLRCSIERSPPRTLQGLAEMLGRRAHGVVDPLDIYWEPNRGTLADALVGRRVMFLAAPRPGEPRDLYRGRVRVTPDGKPISLEQLRNIT